ncbi:uncharacterized protein LOC108594387 [Drosophila busckii]|uniref:uncharacterized protein LOC108594387 n=1 Tax=Drosophila busckii TaxID=30019 RepID=UPI001432E3D8|nr:uncharacterized protein LOC108594387 [Drosophila busckii]
MLQKYFLAAFLLVAVPLCSCIKQTEDNVHHLPIWPTLNGESPYRRLRRQTPPTSNREQLKRCSGYYAHGAYPHGRLILYWHNMQKPRDASRYLSRIITDDLHLPQLASKVIQHDVRNGHILFQFNAACAVLN